MARQHKIEPYSGPSGGWGSARSLGDILTREKTLLRAGQTLIKQNKPGGYACVSCAWAKPAEPHLFEFCENGAKATAWELTSKRVAPDFFAQHSLSALREWPDHDLEAAGRLTHPMRYDAAADRYVPVAWDEAFRDIGARLRGCAPEATVFYTSGRASLETAYMFQLFARLFGTNNLPDSSNMCHETTSVGLPMSIGVPVGTVTLEDFEATDCILFFGQNVGTNSPRMLHDLQKASRRGVPIITFNPLRERGLEEFVNPQAPAEMAAALAGDSTQISSQYHQLRANGDVAAIMGLCKAVIDADDRAQAEGRERVLDVAFIAEHTHGYEEFAALARRCEWADLERRSGLSRAAMEAAATVYAQARAVIANYGMGLTQHVNGLENVHMLVNLLLLRGNIGREGAGISPVRGHSNVQGQRTVGIADDPDLVPLDRLAELYGFEPPREKGLNTVEACEALLARRLRAFIGLGGNFVRAVPDTNAVEPAWGGLDLSVQIATKLNRTHLVPASGATYLLPCLGRIEIDRQATGPQAVSIEDSTACIHGSLGMREPASPDLLSEPRIVAELAKATLPESGRVDWDGWVADYARIRDAIEATYPDDFRDFNTRLFTPGGVPRPLPARERKWATDTGRANFLLPRSLEQAAAEGPRDVLRLMTLRSNDQFNTTIYGYHDRFRGIDGTRMVVMMNCDDIERLQLRDGQIVTLQSAAPPSSDGVVRKVPGFRVTAYDLPEGCCAAYYPECNPLIPLDHHAEGSKVPAAKSVPVRIRPAPAAAE